MCAALWRTVCDGDVGERAEIEARMREGKEKRASELALMKLLLPVWRPPVHYGVTGWGSIAQVLLEML